MRERRVGVVSLVVVRICKEKDFATGVESSGAPSWISVAKCEFGTIKNTALGTLRVGWRAFDSSSPVGLSSF